MRRLSFWARRILLFCLLFPFGLLESGDVAWRYRSRAVVGMDRVIAAVKGALSGEIRRVGTTGINPFVLLVAQIKMHLRLAARGLRLIDNCSTRGALEFCRSRSLADFRM